MKFYKLLCKVVATKKPDARRYLELGCGLGTKFIIAKWAGICDVTGIESNPYYADIAKQLVRDCDFDSAKIEVIDIREFTHYGDYDILYAYSPLKDWNNQLSFRNRVKDEMKSGATFLNVTCFGKPEIWVKP